MVGGGGGDGGLPVFFVSRSCVRHAAVKNDARMIGCFSSPLR